MTAHGLGAFVGWAGFAVMGLVLLGARGRRLPGARLRSRDGAPHLVADGARRHRRDRDDALHGLRGVLGLPLPAALLRVGQLGRLGDRPLLPLRPARGARDRDLVPRDPPHGHEPRGARQRLGLDRQAARALVRLGLPDAAHVRDEGTQGAVRGDPARRDRARHDHRHAPARRAARSGRSCSRSTGSARRTSCWRRTSSGGSATRSSTSCSSRPSPSTTG